MDNVYIKKDDLNSWIAKYFKQDIISINDLIDMIENLDDEIDDLNIKIESLERDIEKNYRPIKKAEQYDISDSEFI